VTDSSALWSRLAAAGLTSGPMPADPQAPAPWYVRVMLGMAGLLAAGFLFGFVALGAAVVLQSRTVSIALGLMLITLAYALMRAAGQRDFAAMFALALSLAGQALVVFGLSGWAEGGFDPGAALWQVAALQAVLAALMPNAIHRTLSAYAGALAFAYACGRSGVPGLASGTVTLAVAALWLSEADFRTRRALALPIAYGLTLWYLQSAAGTLSAHRLAAPAGALSGADAWSWSDAVIGATVLVLTVGVLLRRTGCGLRTPHARIALLATLGVCAASFQAPGVTAGLLIVLLGFANANRVLLGLGLAALLATLGSYYYLLQATLLEKSLLLLATGSLLLAIRWGLSRWWTPVDRPAAEPSDA